MSDEEMACLRWAIIANDDGPWGLFWPTVARSGPVEECERLVQAGLLRLRPGRRELGGYWITPAGRDTLAHSAGIRVVEVRG